MRRKDKEIADDSAVWAVVAQSQVCRLAMVDDDSPYVVPLCFGIAGNILYFHGAARGKKIDLIRKNPNVCVEFDRLFGPIPSEGACDWSMKYQSVIGFGRAALIEDPNEKRTALDLITARYADGGFSYPESRIKATAVIKVQIEKVTGKQSGF